MSVPSINFSTGVLTQELLQNHYEMLASYLRQSITLMSNSGYGVCDSQDPGIRNGSEQKPLWVEVRDATRCYVYSGIAVAPSGEILSFEVPVGTVSLVDLNGGMNLVVLQYSLVDSTSTALTVTNQMVPTGRVGTVALKCITEAQYLGFSESVRNDTVVLAGVVYNAFSGNTVYMSPSQERPWMRRWFSLVDIEHRSRLGSGDVTDTNIHGLGWGDIRTGGLSLYDQFTSSGMVLSKDASISGVPGYFCLDSFSADQIKTDLTGAVTYKSFFGGTNVKYVELSAVPNTLCSVYDAVLNIPVAVDHIPGTNIVVLYQVSKPEVLAVSYTKTASLMLTDTTAGALNFAGISNREIVISNGVPVKRLAQASFPVRRYSNIPRNFRVYIDADGFLIGDPSVLVQSQLIADNKNVNLLASSYVPASPSYIGIGCHGIGNSLAFSLVVRVTGVDIDGIETTENIEFTPETWSDTALPPAVKENDQQVLFTSKSFSSVSEVVVMDDSTHAMVNIQNTATVIVYSKLNAARHRYAQVARGFWNGREVMDANDARRILPVVRDGVYGTTALTATAEVLVGAHEIISGNAQTAQKYKRIVMICAEDFREPKHLDAMSVLWEGREVLDCPVIAKEVQDSSPYKSCYRSRMMPLRKYDSELCGFIVILNSVDSSGVEDGSVRVVMKNDPVFDTNNVVTNYGIAEIVLKPMKDDLSGRIYIGYTRENYRSASFVVSGRCSGFAAYFTNSSDVDLYYVVTATKR